MQLPGAEGAYPVPLGVCTWWCSIPPWISASAIEYGCDKKVDWKGNHVMLFPGWIAVEDAKKRDDSLHNCLFVWPTSLPFRWHKLASHARAQLLTLTSSAHGRRRSPRGRADWMESLPILSLSLWLRTCMGFCNMSGSRSFCLTVP